MVRDGAPRRCRLHQAGTRRARVHADLPRVPRRVRRRRPRPDCGDGARRRHVHARVLRGASAGDRRDVLPAGRRSDPGVLDPHAERAVHRGGGGWRRGRERAAGGLRAYRGGLRPGAGEHHQGRPRRTPGGQRLHRRDRGRQAAGVPPQHRRAARLHRGRGRARAHPPVGERGRGGARRPARHRVRQGGGGHRGRGDPGRRVLRDRGPDHRAVRLRLHPVAPADHTAARLFPGRGGLAARRRHGAGFRRRSDVHPGAVPRVRDRREPRGPDGELDACGGSGRRQRSRGRAGERPPSPAAWRGRAGLRFGGIHHHLVHRGPGHEGDRHHREPRGGSNHPHQPGAATGAALVLRGERRTAPRDPRARRPAAAGVVADGASRAPGPRRRRDRCGSGAPGRRRVRGSRGSDWRRAPGCAGAAGRVRLQPRLRRDHGALRYRCRCPDGDRGDGGGGLHRLRRDAHPRRLRMARPQRGRRPVGARARRHHEQHSRDVERRQPEMADRPPQSLHDRAVRLPGADEQRAAEPRLQCHAGVDLHGRPQGRDHRARGRGGEGIRRRESGRPHRVPARLRQRRRDGGDQRRGGGVAVPDPCLRLRRGHRAVPAVIPVGGGNRVHHCAARGGQPARLRAHGAARDRPQGVHPSGRGARGGNRGGLRHLHLRAAPHPARGGSRLRHGLRADAGYHRSGGRAHRPHPGRRGRYVDRRAVEVPG